MTALASQCSTTERGRIFDSVQGGGKPNTPGWAKPGSPTAQNYTLWMKYIYIMQVCCSCSGERFDTFLSIQRVRSLLQNLTFGEDGGLTKACQAKHPAEPWLCFMSPHMQVWCLSAVSV